MHLVGRKSGGSGGGERKKPIRARVLSLPGSSMRKHGKEKEGGNGVLGNDGFAIPSAKGFGKT